jgi:hypothetical protein
MILGTASGMPVVAAVATDDRDYHAVQCPYCPKVHAHGGWGPNSPAGAVNGGRWSGLSCEAEMQLYVIAEVPGTARLFDISPDGMTLLRRVAVDQVAAELLKPEIDAFIAKYELTWVGPEKLLPCGDYRERIERRPGPFGEAYRWPYSYFTNGPVRRGTQWAELDARRPAPLSPHALYRFFGADGSLLYIGLTMNPGTRWPSHAREKPWWLAVHTVTIEHFPDRPSVEAAERAAIRAERPRHNVVHNRRPAIARSVR